MNYNMEKQHKLGKLHALERICAILDEDSFREIGSGITNLEDAFNIKKGQFPYDGVITGYGTVNGQEVMIYAEDFTVIGGTLGKQHGFKIANAIRMAIENRCPIIGINDSGGARIQEGINALAGYGEIFYYNTLASGYIPQISIIAGNCAGGAVYSPGITDFIFVIDDISQMFVTGPKVIKSVTNEDITANELGGAAVHAGTSGVAHFHMPDEKTCYKKVRELIDIIPPCYDSNKSHLELKQNINYTDNMEFNDDLAHVLPEHNNQSYDIHDIIKGIVDPGSFLEIMEEFAKNVVIGFGKIKGITIGIISDQPKVMAGVLDCDSSDKIARFIRYCDSFDIPIITLTDVPGFMPGKDQEYKGIIRHGAKVLYAYSEATTTKINVILRKAYGGAYIAMSSKHLRADFVYAWPTAEIAVMGAEGAADILYGKQMKDMAPEEKATFRQEKIDEYNEKFMNPEIAAMHGYIDEVIRPEATRERIYADLLICRSKKALEHVSKKHGNIPL
ncbi:MAG TPA: methylmalonyl-CoA carboxyltransferase [Lachnospiraceae bacterium]|nr:methylmalonyl-CoA carboxyltransferase [Lachnospiraceae bacterium]